jgi:hypothetical protein
MAAGGFPSDDATGEFCEAELMAVVLEGRHGNFAAEVAEFFATLHRQCGDQGRSRAWSGVANAVRKREQERLIESLN